MSDYLVCHSVYSCIFVCVQSLPRAGKKYLKGNRNAQKTPFGISLKRKLFSFSSLSPPENTSEIPCFSPECAAVKAHGMNEIQAVVEKCTTINV